MISTRSAGLVINTVVCLTLAKWETVSGRFGGYLIRLHGVVFLGLVNRDARFRAPKTEAEPRFRGYPRGLNRQVGAKASLCRHCPYRLRNQVETEPAGLFAMVGGLAE
jgi:hypothetical protein